MATRKLSTYRRKRDFSKTAEPSGARRLQRSTRLRFVIQKHDARRAHYDLRLELDGVFKSWAVTRGPSLDPSDKRLAVEVEDHPLDYGDFEGTIPQGEYGGGTVQLWDRGYWQPEGSQSPQHQLRDGDLKFQLFGERLRGSWVLVRMKKDRRGGKRVNWLLIKHRDQEARAGATETLLRQDRSVASGRPMAQIAAGKGRSPKPFMLSARSKAGADAVWRSDRVETRSARPRSAAAMPAFVSPELAQLVGEPPRADGWGHEIKFDGYRMQLRVAASQARLRTRRGLDWTEKFPVIARAARVLPDAILDGEIVALDEHGVSSFSRLQEALSAGQDGRLVFFAFDLLFAGDEDLRPLPLWQRKQRLNALLKGLGGKRATPIHYVDDVQSEGDEVLRKACGMGLEGIISKRLDAPYRSGRSSAWTKAKCRAGQEVVIGGWTLTQGAFRSLLAGVFRDGRLIYVGRIGTGFGRDTVRSLLPRLKAVQQNTSPFEGPNAPRAASNMRWTRPELVAEVEFAGWTGDGNLRQAAFKGLREDKPSREVVMEKPTDRSGKAASPSRPARTTAARRGQQHDEPAPRTRQAARRKQRDSLAAASVLGISISSADKDLWPADGALPPVTKLDLARYFAEVGEWMLPHIRERPCSIVRAPDGIEGEQFFQRHAMAGQSEALDLVKVRGDRKPYLQINRVEGLIAAAQIAALELHPSNCRPGEPLTAGRLVFDLDPAPDVDFNAVIRAAREIRERLERVGLVAFCKTTGGKGLHVVTPLAPPGRGQQLDWKLAKTFAQTVCAQMQADSPDRYIINMSKASRNGRIFLDYLRNDLTATAVAPLSTRARPGATVSMPLPWTKVRAGLDQRRFTLRTAPALIARSAAWEGYGKAERSIFDAIRRLTQVRLGKAGRHQA